MAICIGFPRTSSVLSCIPYALHFGKWKSSPAYHMQWGHFSEIFSFKHIRYVLYLCWWCPFQRTTEATVATTNYKHRSPRAKRASAKPRLSNIISHLLRTILSLVLFKTEQCYICECLILSHFSAHNWMRLAWALVKAKLPSFVPWALARQGPRLTWKSGGRTKP